MCQRENATRSSVLSGTSAGAFDRKYFTSPVRTSLRTRSLSSLPGFPSSCGKNLVSRTSQTIGPLSVLLIWYFFQVGPPRSQSFDTGLAFGAPAPRRDLVQPVIEAGISTTYVSPNRATLSR